MKLFKYSADVSDLMKQKKSLKLKSINPTHGDML